MPSLPENRLLCDLLAVDRVRKRLMTPDAFAPGWPGIPARWTSSAKTGLGTAIGRDSRVWFTVGHGILNEV